MFSRFSRFTSLSLWLSVVTLSPIVGIVGTVLHANPAYAAGKAAGKITSKAENKQEADLVIQAKALIAEGQHARVSLQYPLNQTEIQSAENILAWKDASTQRLHTIYQLLTKPRIESKIDDKTWHALFALVSTSPIVDDTVINNMPSDLKNIYRRFDIIGLTAQDIKTGVKLLNKETVPEAEITRWLKDAIEAGDAPLATALFYQENITASHFKMLFEPLIQAYRSVAAPVASSVPYRDVLRMQYNLHNAYLTAASNTRIPMGIAVSLAEMVGDGILQDLRVRASYMLPPALHSYYQRLRVDPSLSVLIEPTEDIPIFTSTDLDKIVADISQNQRNTIHKRSKATSLVLVALHPNASPDLLEMLAKDENPLIRTAALSNANLSGDVLERTIRDGMDVILRETLHIDNENRTTTMPEDIHSPSNAHFPSALFTTSPPQNFDLKRATQQFHEVDIIYSALYNPNVPTKIIDEIIEKKQCMKQLATGATDGWCRTVLPRLPLGQSAGIGTASEVRIQQLLALPYGPSRNVILRDLAKNSTLSLSQASLIVAQIIAQKDYKENFATLSTLATHRFSQEHLHDFDDVAWQELGNFYVQFLQAADDTGMAILRYSAMNGIYNVMESYNRFSKNQQKNKTATKTAIKTAPLGLGKPRRADPSAPSANDVIRSFSLLLAESSEEPHRILASSFLSDADLKHFTDLGSEENLQFARSTRISLSADQLDTLADEAIQKNWFYSKYLIASQEHVKLKTLKKLFASQNNSVGNITDSDAELLLYKLLYDGAGIGNEIRDTFLRNRDDAHHTEKTATLMRLSLDHRSTYFRTEALRMWSSDEPSTLSPEVSEVSNELSKMGNPLKVWMPRWRRLGSDENLQYFHSKTADMTLTGDEIAKWVREAAESGSGGDWTYFLAAQHPNTHATTLQWIAQRGDLQARGVLAARDNLGSTDEERLALQNILAQDSSLYVRLRLAKRTDVMPSVVQKLFSEGQPDILANLILQNTTKIDSAQKQLFLQHPNERIRATAVYAFGQYNRLTIEQLKTLQTDPSWLVRLALLEVDAPNGTSNIVPAQMVQAIYQEIYQNAVQNAVGASQMPKQSKLRGTPTGTFTAQEALDPRAALILPSLIRHPAIKPEQIASLYEVYQKVSDSELTHHPALADVFLDLVATHALNRALGKPILSSNSNADASHIPFLNLVLTGSSKGFAGSDGGLFSVDDALWKNQANGPQKSDHLSAHLSVHLLTNDPTDIADRDAILQFLLQQKEAHIRLFVAVRFMPQDITKPTRNEIEVMRKLLQDPSVEVRSVAVNNVLRFFKDTKEFADLVGIVAKDAQPAVRFVLADLAAKDVGTTRKTIKTILNNDADPRVQQKMSAISWD